MENASASFDSAVVYNACEAWLERNRIPELDRDDFAFVSSWKIEVRKVLRLASISKRISLSEEFVDLIFDDLTEVL